MHPLRVPVVQKTKKTFNLSSRVSLTRNACLQRPQLRRIRHRPDREDSPLARIPSPALRAQMHELSERWLFFYDDRPPRARAAKTKRLAKQRR